MTKAEKDRRITYLLKRKEALTWKWIGACEELNAQIETLRMTEVEHEPDKKTETTV